MISKRFIFHTAILACALVIPVTSHAKSQQVGPTSFHKQLNLPHTLGRNGNLNANNEDGYEPSSRAEQRQKRRAQRQQQQKAANEEPRTESDHLDGQRRKGRRDQTRNTPRERRLQQQAWDRLEGTAKDALNN